MFYIFICPYINILSGASGKIDKHEYWIIKELRRIKFKPVHIKKISQIALKL